MNHNEQSLTLGRNFARQRQYKGTIVEKIGHAQTA